MTTIRDARGIVYLTNYYDANNRVFKQVQIDGSTYQFNYFVAGGLQVCGGTCPISGSNVIETDVTDPRGYVRKVTFNSDGYSATDTHAFGQPEQQTITYNRQPNSGLVLGITDALNRQTTYTYDANANVTSVTSLTGTSNAATRSFAYEPTFNRVTAFTVAVLLEGCGLIPRKVTMDDAQVQRLVKAAGSFDRTSNGFSPIPRQADVRLELRPTSRYDAMLHITTKTVRTIAFRKGLLGADVLRNLFEVALPGIPITPDLNPKHLLPSRVAFSNHFRSTSPGGIHMFGNP